jgi:hypothetical protein
MPEERASLLEMTCNYRAEIVDRERANRFADIVPTRGFFGRLRFSLKSLISCGERAGARTQDPVIKSHVLYRLSYALPWPPMASLGSIAIVFGHSEKHILPQRNARREENRQGVSRSCFRPALCRGSGR